MRTPKQIAASRANGAKSKGPVTPEGKRNSSRNSTRHGMFADTLVLEREKPDQFHELLNELLDEHQPSTPTQMMLVETIVAARWRQQRIWGIQKPTSITTSPRSRSTPKIPLFAPPWLCVPATRAFAHTNSSSVSKSPSTARSPDPSTVSSSSRTNKCTARMRSRKRSRS